MIGNLARPSWPMTIKVPVVVAAMMMLVSALLTERVLSRLAATQEAHLRELTGAYLDALSFATLPHVLRNDVWEVFDALDRSGRGHKGLEVIWTVVASAEGRVIASSDPHLFSTDTAMPADVRGLFRDSVDVVVDRAAPRAHVRRVLRYQGRDIGAVYADVDISGLRAERREILATLLLTNAALTIALAVLGYLAVRRMVRPVSALADHIARGRSGTVEPLPAHLMPHVDSELGRLIVRYNELVAAVRSRETLAAQLAEEEKLASLGRLTSGIAHEINNPLGGMFNAIDALERHGQNAHVRATSVGLLKRGLAGIRDVVGAALETYRQPDARRVMVAGDLDDIRLLVAPELRRRGLRLEWNNALDRELTVGVTPLRQALLNLVLNACFVTPRDGAVIVNLACDLSGLTMAVSDGGPGLSESQRAYLERRGAGSAPLVDGGGLGLWMVRRWADETGATIACSPGAAGGTTIAVMMPLDGQEARHAA